MMNDYWLLEKATVKEQEFASQTPLLGSFIVWFRTQWNNVATKWYVRPLLLQQNEFNRLASHSLYNHDVRLIELDRQQSELIRQVAELTLHLKQAQHHITALEQQIKALQRS